MNVSIRVQGHPIISQAKALKAAFQKRKQARIELLVKKKGRSNTMHARVVTGQYVPGKEDEIAQVAKEALETNMKPQEGFKNRIFLLDPDNNKFLAISLWEEEAHAQKNFPATYQQAKEGAQQHLTAEPVAETYQVRYFE